ncbi:M23 family metallopeptidase [Acaryochloris sp. CCMEE 5410]|uniref:M23 family metallopeptidase n=1 Tax=Acaryochloris sp. CCMEE 5410 TaxID=310037 RepID=UPI000248402C|nr:M23 family metallopeptidase [Acaryochloris sp. CCMEE 5410]KAI9134115.1 M23 family metallopeptidase [Acaryochloris sp. CCMEE 5410]
MSYQNLRRLSVLLFATVGSTLSAALSAQALDVTVTPKKPRLGDTLAITVKPDPGEQLTQAPVVKVAGKKLPVYPVAANRWRAFLPTIPLEKHGRRSLIVTGNQQARNMVLWIGKKWFRTQSIWLPPGKGSGTDFEFDRVDAFKAIVSPKKLWSGKFLRPNNGPLTAGYGIKRIYNGDYSDPDYHRGLDYAGWGGSPVKASAAGQVRLVGRESQGFRIHGNVVGIDHGQGVNTVYLHLRDIKVREGQRVQAGQIIGTVGSTGASTGPHLHFGLNVNGQAVDPTPWLKWGFQ